jgi:hypothetical protein
MKNNPHAQIAHADKQALINFLFGIPAIAAKKGMYGLMAGVNRPIRMPTHPNFLTTASALLRNLVLFFTKE